MSITPRHMQMQPCVISLRSLAKTRVLDSSQKMDRSRRTRQDIILVNTHRKFITANFNSIDHSSVFKRLGSSTSTCFIAKAAMHRTWRSKELRCQSNKYQTASEAGELEVFASPRPLSSLLRRSHVVDAIASSI